MSASDRPFKRTRMPPPRCCPSLGFTVYSAEVCAYILHEMACEKSTIILPSRLLGSQLWADEGAQVWREAETRDV